MPEAARCLYRKSTGTSIMKPFFRKLHRWLGLLMALQIIAWMGSGLYFAIFPIETIRGEHLMAEPEKISVQGLEQLITPEEAWRAVSEALGNGITPGSLSIHASMGETWYRVSGYSEGEGFTRLVHARTGAMQPFLDAGQVSGLARASLAADGDIKDIQLVESHRDGSEYRGRQLPIWRVTFGEPENLHMYIDGWTGDILARRTDRWRIFDFLWMLHIMDFDERDDFNTPLLQVAAALGLLVAISGVVFWAMTTRLFRRRKLQH
jgi:hypothetical protein